MLEEWPLKDESSLTKLRRFKEKAAAAAKLKVDSAAQVTHIAEEVDDFVPEEYAAQGFKPTLTVSVKQKVQVTQYEPAEAFLSMSITADTTQAEMDEILANGKIAFNKLAKEIRKRIANLEAGQALGRVDARED